MTTKLTVPDVYSLAMALDTDERLHLLHLLLDAHHTTTEITPSKERTPGLHLGVFEMADDFDAPFDDEFWLGTDEK